MSTAISKITAQSMLQFYIDAETAVLKGQTVTHGDRTLSRANLAEIREGRRDWQAYIDGLTAAESGHQSRVAFADWNSS